jgi:hypothetical protein
MAKNGPDIPKMPEKSSITGRFWGFLLTQLFFYGNLIQKGGGP